MSRTQGKTRIVRVSNPDIKQTVRINSENLYIRKKQARNIRKKYLTLIALLTFLVPSLLSCQDDDDISSDFLKDSIESFEDSDGFVIKDGMIVQPEWLASAVDSVALSHKPNEFGHYTYPMVFKVSHEGKDYYLVDDPWKSTMDYVVLTLKGKRISVDEAWDIINEKNRVILWFEPLKEEPSTKAYVGTANVYTHLTTFSFTTVDSHKGLMLTNT